MDLAGNVAQLTVGGISIDKTAPVVSVAAPVNGASLLLRQVVTFAYTCTDALSGVVSCAGPSAAGSRVDTTSVGAQAFSVTVADAAGNTAVSSASFNVVYRFGGFLQPIALPVSTFKSGSTIPVKFRLADASGAAVASAEPLISADDDEPLGEATFQDGHYHFNLRTKGLHDGPLTITVSLDDGTSHSVAVVLK